METTGNDEVGKEALTLVLEEFATEQKDNNKVIADLVSAVNGLSSTVSGFNKELEKPKTISVSTDTKPVQEIVRKGLVDIQLMVGAQPKPVVRKFQLLLFPEQDAKLFYKVVFSRWFLWLVIMLAITDLYKWGLHYNEVQREVQVEQLENERIRKAWDDMYRRNGKGVKALMEKSYLWAE